MELHFQATYQDGALRPDVPLALPDRTRVEVTVKPEGTLPAGQFDQAGLSPASSDQDLAEEFVLPNAPRLTVEALRRILDNHGASVGTLPVDFDRHDIYSDHD